MAVPAGDSKAPPTQAQPQPLSFPPALFARLAPADFLHASLTSGAACVRPNGRGPREVRQPSVNTGSLTNANGSAVARLGATSVVCGVRAELLPVANMHGGLPADLEAWQTAANGARGRAGAARPADADAGGARADADVVADLRLLVPNLELATGCDAAHLPGNAPGAEAQALTQRIAALLRTADLVGVAPLLVWYERPLSADREITAAGNPNDPDVMVEEGDEGLTSELEIKAVWTLYIDILYISLDGAAFDAAWLAVLAALRNTLLPKARWDEDREIILCSPMKADATPLELRSLPVPLSSAVFSHSTSKDSEPIILYDVDGFEESICQGQLAVVITREVGSKGKPTSKGTKLIRVEAHGKGIELVLIPELVKAAEDRWTVWRSTLDWDG